MFKSRKGITPVIAIVLLILITLGMIGIVWTQFQGILQFGDQASGQQQAINTQLTIESVYNDGGNMRITWRNPNDRALNTSNFKLGFSQTSGGSPVTASIFAANTQFGTSGTATCFDDGASELVSPSDQQDCATGLDWPSDKPIDMYLKVSMKGADKSFSYNCETDTTNAFSC